MRATYISIFLIGALGVFSYFYFGIDQVLPLPQCQIFKYTGIHCQGCGTQRAIKSLIDLDLASAISNNALFVAAMFGVIICLPIWAFNHKVRSYLYTSTTKGNVMIYILIVVLIFVVFRNIPIEPFSWLAPLSKN